ncbi:hypothetical protein HZA97_06145 [Candidatus Woesearchaeota archaeon]|nr:hypothetical protein [Candidatus Woesearchaeota archaeon]
MKKFLTSLGLSILLSIPFSGCYMPPKREAPELSKQSCLKASILISDPTNFWESLRGPFMGIYERAVISSLEEKLNVYPYEIKYSATWEDLQKVLLDDSINVVVVTGHGDWQGWLASDMPVNEEALSEFVSKNNIKPKKYFIRHTCGEGNYKFYNENSLNEYVKRLESRGCENIKLLDGVYLDCTLMSDFLEKKYNQLLIQHYGKRSDFSELEEQLRTSGCVTSAPKYPYLIYVYCNTESIKDNKKREVVNIFLKANNLQRVDNYSAYKRTVEFLKKEAQSNESLRDIPFFFDFIQTVNFSAPDETSRKKAEQLVANHEQKEKEHYDKVYKDEDRIFELFRQEYQLYEKYFESYTIFCATFLIDDSSYRESISKFKEKLKEERKPLGSSVAETVLGWDRITTPFDFLNDPLAQKK